MPVQGPAVLLEGVTVRYGRRQALTDVTAAFPVGATGLLGPNGAGKSTLLRALLGLIVPDAGRMEVLGLDVARAPMAVRARIGYMPEGDAHIPGMNAVSFVAYCGELAGMPPGDAMQRAHDVLFHVGLGDARYRTIDTYSTGMKQRIKLAQALVHDPDLLFLDEPTNGLDPRGREEMLDLIRGLAGEQEMTLILSSHLLPDVERTCDSVVVLDGGRVVAQGAIEALRPRGDQLFELRVKGTDGLAPFRESLRLAGCTCVGAAAAEDEGEGGDASAIHVVVPAGGSVRDIFCAAAAAGMQVRHLRPSTPSLDEVFARAVGER
ncbi:MAG: ATP-binding cassette domain-containing protein [Vicinamibacterales bacterium]